MIMPSRTVPFECRGKGPMHPRCSFEVSANVRLIKYGTENLQGSGTVERSLIALDLCITCRLEDRTSTIPKSMVGAQKALMGCAYRSGHVLTRRYAIRTQGSNKAVIGYDLSSMFLLGECVICRRDCFEKFCGRADTNTL